MVQGLHAGACEVEPGQGLILEVEHDVGKVKVHLEGYNDQILRMPIGNWKLAKFMTHTGEQLRAALAACSLLRCRHNRLGSSPIA